MSDQEVEVLSKQDLIDVGNIMLCQYMYYGQKYRIEQISKTLSVDQDTVTKYLSIELPKDERAEKVINYISVKCLKLLDPLEGIMKTIVAEIEGFPTVNEDTPVKNVLTRNGLIKSYSGVIKAYMSILETLRRVHAVGEKEGGSSFNLTLIEDKSTKVINQ